MDSARYRSVFGSLPTLKTERLSLGKIVPENANDMFAYASLGESTKYLLWNSHLNINETKGYIEYLQREYRKGNYADWGITLLETGTFIGTVGFASIDLQNNSGEVGYVINPAYWGNGYAHEALNRILSVAFEQLLLHRVQLRIMEGNVRSEHLALSAGFRKEGSLRDLLLVKGTYRTINIFSLLDSEYVPH